MPKSEIFRYLDYREFVRDWLASKKVGRSRLSLRQLAERLGVTPGFLSLALSGKRPLGQKSLRKLAEVMALSDRERDFLLVLSAFCDAKGAEKKKAALEEMKRFKNYRANNPREAEVHQYLSRWFNVAIREMCSIPGFQADPEWIQSRLRKKVELREIKKALAFLQDSGFMEMDSNGKAKLPQKQMDCLAEVFRVGMATFHRQMLSMAADSIEYATREERQVLGHVFALPEASYREACGILTAALDKIRELETAESQAETVYALELALFPLSKKLSR